MRLPAGIRNALRRTRRGDADSLPGARGVSPRFRDRSRCTRILLARLLRDGTLSRGDRVLAIGAGEYERDLFESFGFTDVLLAGFATTADVDARRLPFDDESFDLVFVEAVLHHVDAPHRCVLEMYRVSRKSIIICETEENLFTNTLVRLGLIESYELSGVRAEGGSTGGVNNTQVPNHVYRWYRSELPKVFRSLDPSREPVYTVERSLQLYGQLGPVGRLIESGASALLPGFGNCFAFHLRKRAGTLQPWLTESDGVVRFTDGDSR